MDSFWKAIRTLFLISSLVSLGLLMLNFKTVTALVDILLHPNVSTEAPAPNSSAGPEAEPDKIPQLATMLRSSAPNSLQAQMAAGVLFLRRNMNQEAMEAFKSAIALEPQNPKAHFMLGMIMMKHDQWDEARKEFQEAVRLDPENTDARFGLAASLQHTSTLDSAIEQYKEIMRLKPLNSEAHNNLGVVYEAQGRFDDALQEFKTAQNLAPNDAQVQNNLAGLMQTMGSSSPTAKSGGNAPSSPPAVPSSFGEPSEGAAMLAPADTVRLENGRIFTGTILERTDTGVWLQVKSGKIFFSDSEIAEISASKSS